MAYHTACHVDKAGWAPYTLEVLKKIPGLEIIMLPSQCCGIAGTYGFKSETMRFHNLLVKTYSIILTKVGLITSYLNAKPVNGKLICHPM